MDYFTLKLPDQYTGSPSKQSTYARYGAEPILSKTTPE